MDLYSAARRLAKPFIVTRESRRAVAPIGEHGLIGDGVTSALVRIDGTIDWLCFPRFDSPSVFASILDMERGGSTSISPTADTFESNQRYDPDTNVLESLFGIPDRGVVRLTDYMPWSDDPRSSIHQVHRRIECREGEVELEVIFDPRFEYGAVAPIIDITEHGVLATGPNGETIVAVLSGTRWHKRAEGGVHATIRLRAGQRAWNVISWGDPHPEPIAAYRPFEHLRTTRQAWREWSRRIQYDGPWRHHVMRSALLLKLLIYGPTGAMVAAPTTSLPEGIGGTRNWDYRYAWTRDAGLAIRAANLIGCDAEAREFFHFVRDTLDRGNELQVMYAIDGGAVPEEQILEHLSGYANSRPVRIGNGARDQIQLDTAGALIDAAFLYERFGGAITLNTWRHLRNVANTAYEKWSEPDHGIWEIRRGTRHHVHSKLMSWVALDRARRLAPLFGGTSDAERLREAAGTLRQQVLSEALDPTGRHFVSWYGGSEPDASLLLIPIYGFLPPDDPRVTATINWVQRELSDGPFLKRYLSEDGIEGGEGSFVLCGFWLSEALALAGRLDDAQEVFVAHAEASNHLGLLSEEIDSSNGALIGNFPQAFSHLGLINAAARIDRGLRMRDEGSTKLPRFLTDPT